MRYKTGVSKMKFLLFSRWFLCVLLYICISVFLSQFIYKFNAPFFTSSYYSFVFFCQILCRYKYNQFQKHRNIKHSIAEKWNILYSAQLVYCSLFSRFSSSYYSFFCQIVCRHKYNQFQKIA